jgi:hypothetical protein
MRAVKDRPEPFVHKTGRYFPDGKEFIVYPSRLRAYPLAVGIIFGKLDEAALEVYKREFLSRVSPCIEDACERENLAIGDFKVVLKGNLEKVIGMVMLKTSNNPNYWMIKREYMTRDERDTNSSIFHMRICDVLIWLCAREYIRKVCED